MQKIGRDGDEKFADGRRRKKMNEEDDIMVAQR